MRKPVHINPNFHNAMWEVKSKTGATLAHQVHEGLRLYFETYHPHLVPLLSGGEVDESQRPAPFENG